MSKYVKKYKFPALSNPTIILGGSGSHSEKAELFSWETTLEIPEDPFFDVERVTTVADDLMSVESQ